MGGGRSPLGADVKGPIRPVRFYDKAGLEALEQKGVISAGRRQALLSFPWRNDIVFHEVRANDAMRCDAMRCDGPHYHNDHNNQSP
jgi:hypothetical protein